MKEWLNAFWKDHGDRLVFMGIVTIFGVAFILLKMTGEGKTLLVAVATLALNKARSKPNGIENTVTAIKDKLTS